MMDEERGKGRREGEREKGGRGGKKGEVHTHKHRE